MSERGARVLPLRDDGGAGRAVFMHMALAIEARALCAAKVARLRARVCGSARVAPAPAGTFTLRAADNTWRPLAAGVAIKLLSRDPVRGRMTAFIRMQPGAMFDAHDHPQAEECLVLEGEISIGTHRLEAGDLHVAAAGTRHARTCSPQGALLLVHAVLPASSCATY
jgi:quercetin dioxygenase-like cupin family protein